MYVLRATGKYNVCVASSREIQCTYCEQQGNFAMQFLKTERFKKALGENLLVGRVRKYEST